MTTDRVTDKAYEAAWSALRRRLQGLEFGAGGLPAALAALERQQHAAGFINDDLAAVEHSVFSDPADPRRVFRAQYNPRRALRFAGAGRSDPPAGVQPIHDGCFLCRENIRWQQEGRQLGYEIALAGVPYIAWMNPFPLLPGHVVVASATHRAQAWIFGPEGPARAGGLLASLLDFADRTPGHLGYFNGVGSGASIPGHLHFHFCRRPGDGMRFPLELAADRTAPADGAPGVIEDYPLTGVFWRGAREAVLAAALSWLQDWAARNAHRLDRLTANLIATKARAGAALSLYFVPRLRPDATTAGHAGHAGRAERIGGLEVLGEFVFSTPAEKRLLDEGAIDYATIEAWLARVRTPLFDTAPAASPS